MAAANVVPEASAAVAVAVPPLPYPPPPLILVRLLTIHVKSLSCVVPRLLSSCAMNINEISVMHICFASGCLFLLLCRGET